jgi:glycine/serine hydroxymethyltransferase
MESALLLQNKVLYAPLAEIDPQVQNIIDKETWRQFTGLELIASEVDLTVYCLSISMFSETFHRT